MVKDKNGKALSKGDSVIVPDPEQDDSHYHSYVGTIVGFREDTDGTALVSVEDGDGEVMDVAANRVELGD